MVFQNSRLSKDYKFDFNSEFEELNIPSFDGKKLNGLLFKTPKPKGLIFYLHGNARTLESWGYISQIYTNFGYDIFILDYRSYGKSEGNIASQLQFLKDISVVYKAILKRYDEKDIIITGYSIGTGPATYLASTNNPKALILQSPYFNFLEFSSHRVPLIPDFIKKFKFETNEFITKIKSPIYIFHGKNDKLISFDNSIRLSKLFKPTDQLFLLENQDHFGMNENQDYLKELNTILKQ